MAKRPGTLFTPFGNRDPWNQYKQLGLFQDSLDMFGKIFGTNMSGQRTKHLPDGRIVVSSIDNYGLVPVYSSYVSKTTPSSSVAYPLPRKTIVIMDQGDVFVDSGDGSTSRVLVDGELYTKLSSNILPFTGLTFFEKNKCNTYTAPLALDSHNAYTSFTQKNGDYYDTDVSTGLGLLFVQAKNGAGLKDVDYWIGYNKTLIRSPAGDYWGIFIDNVSHKVFFQKLEQKIPLLDCLKKRMENNVYTDGRVEELALALYLAYLKVPQGGIVYEIAFPSNMPVPDTNEVVAWPWAWTYQKKGSSSELHAKATKTFTKRVAGTDGYESKTWELHFTWDQDDDTGLEAPLAVVLDNVYSSPATFYMSSSSVHRLEASTSSTPTRYYFYDGGDSFNFQTTSAPIELGSWFEDDDSVGKFTYEVSIPYSSESTVESICPPPGPPLDYTDGLDYYLQFKGMWPHNTQNALHTYTMGASAFYVGGGTVVANVSEVTCATHAFTYSEDWTGPFYSLVLLVTKTPGVAWCLEDEGLLHKDWYHTEPDGIDAYGNPIYVPGAFTTGNWRSVLVVRSQEFQDPEWTSSQVYDYSDITNWFNRQYGVNYFNYYSGSAMTNPRWWGASGSPLHPTWLIPKGYFSWRNRVVSKISPDTTPAVSVGAAAILESVTFAGFVGAV